MKNITTTIVGIFLWMIAARALPGPSQTDSKEQDGIQFNCTIPHLTDKLSLFSLGKRAQFPLGVLEGILKSAAPSANLTENSLNGSLYFYDDSRLVGYFDNTTGESTVFPNLESLKPTNNFRVGGINQFLDNPKIFPADDTNRSIVIGPRLDGSTTTLNGTVSPPAGYLLEVLVQRSILVGREVSLVCGPGTKASFSIGSDNSAKGLSHRWRSATKLSSKIAPVSRNLIQGRIISELTAAKVTSNVTVRSVELCFYDSGKRFIQPVFKWNATVSHPFGLTDDVIVGYIPAGEKAQEALPTLNPPKGQITPTPASNETTTVGIDKRQARGITVGRYAMSNDQYSPQIVVDENAFWNGLQSASSRFINSEYFWDEPFIYESSAEFFVDRVNIAFTEGHGNVHLFTTNESEPGWGPVHISSDLPTNGFGPGAGGALAYWIIRACDTISTPADYSVADFHKAFDPWWSVFNGMHAVMGYRTIASVYDNEMGTVGKVLGLGASVVHGWMTAALGGGKTSAVTVCGHADDTVFQLANLGRPECLQIWWYN